MNMRDYVSDDHIESIGEIATGQARIIQALSLDNLQKDKEIERLNNIINKLDSFDWIIEVKNELYIDCNGNEGIFKYYDEATTKLTRKFFLILREIKGEDK